MIPDEAVEAAKAAIWDLTDMPVPFEWQREMLARAALAAAAPHMLADHLLTLAADVRTRGDIGKEGGVEAWDYLTRQAEKIRPTP